MHDEHDAPASDELVAHALIEDVYRRYVHLVLAARIGAGTWSDDDGLSRFVVYLDEPVVICINDEPHGWHMARARRSFKPDEEIHPVDLQAEQVPRPEHRRPYFSASITAEGWQAKFDFSRPHPASGDLMAAAAEFLDAAETAHGKGALRVFVENAFHAAETFARIELLSYPVTADELDGSKKHSQVQAAYDLWLRLGNTDSRFPALLRELHDLRASATYADKPFTLDKDAASRQLRTLQDLAKHARDTLGSTKGRTINVIATRPIRAGELVSAPDMTIRPPKKQRRPPSDDT